MRPETWPAGFGAGGRERDALLVLAHLRTTTARRLLEVARREGSAAGCLAAARAGELGAVDRTVAAAVDPHEARACLREAGARLVGPGDAAYPARLLDLPDPPAALFVRGELPQGPAVAIVGARRCSAYGRDLALAIARGLAVEGVTVVSGAARGIDGAAHRGALEGDGPTIAVLGSGIDVAYPPAHRPLLEQIVASGRGALVSEYPPGTKAAKWHFPARNRIVAALAVGVLVVEGAPGSGSTISVEHAADIGRDILAVPGPVTNPLSAVPHELIREGAALVRGAADVLEAIGRVPSSTGGTADLRDLPPEERRTYDALRGEGMTLDEVARSARLAPGAVLGALVSLEIRGLVRAGGGRYGRAPDLTSTH